MKYAVVGKKLFDGHQLLQDFYFIVNDEEIVEIGAYDQEKVKDLEVIDVKDQLVTPGIIDAHVHICADPYHFGAKTNPYEMTVTIMDNLKTLLAQGIVYVRDVGAPVGVTEVIRELVAKKRIQGPSLKISGEAICVTGGHGWQMSKECDSSDEVRKAVRNNIKAGTDLIKLMVTGGINTPGEETAPLEMSEAEIMVAIEEAHKKKRKVAVHTHGRTGIELCLKHGVDSLEHALFLDDELAEIAKRKGIAIVPTLSAPYFAVVAGLKKDPTSKSFKKSEEVMGIHNFNTFNAYKKGVRIVMGTDSGTPFNGFETALEELVLLKNIGIDALDVLRISTSHGAELLTIEDTHGSLAIGKKASFIIFEEDPLLDMNNVKGNKVVYQNGQRVN